MLIEIHDHALVERLTELLQKRFDGDPDRMLAELLRLYSDRLSRLDYSGRIQWPGDALEYQHEVRD